MLMPSHVGMRRAAPLGGHGHASVVLLLRPMGLRVVAKVPTKGALSGTELLVAMAKAVVMDARRFL